jgi:putative aldouronate transport system permease protein
VFFGKEGGSPLLPLRAPILPAGDPYQTMKAVSPKGSLLASTARDFRLHKWIYLMAVPVLAYYVLFCYLPMYGAIIAFKDFRGGLGILGSPWVGLKHFKSLFASAFLGRIVRNTVLLSVWDLAVGFPAPIIFALLMNELRNRAFKRGVQTISYIPHFISLVVVCGMVTDMLSSDGLLNDILVLFGRERLNYLLEPQWFRTIYVGSGVWTSMGWGSIIYLAALSGVDPQLYEAAVIDGAGRWKQLLHVTLPTIVPTIVVLLILSVGGMFSIGWEKVLLLYNPLTYDTADIISTYVYRRGLGQSDYSFSAAIGLMNSLVNLVMLYLANKISRAVGETSLW